MTYKLALLEREELGREKALLESLRSVMKKLNLSAKEAIEAWGVPKDEQHYYLFKLSKNFEAEEL